jgi:hypothetical protein
MRLQPGTAPPASQEPPRPLRTGAWVPAILVLLILRAVDEGLPPGAGEALWLRWARGASQGTYWTLIGLYLLFTAFTRPGRVAEDHSG